MREAVRNEKKTWRLPSLFFVHFRHGWGKRRYVPDTGGLYVKAEEHYVAVLHYVLLALRAHLTLFARAREPAKL